MTPATVTQLHPAEGDARTEAMLTELGIPYELDPNLPLDRIDLKRSQQNQARLEALDHNLVDAYRVALDDGAVFPPVIARRTSPRARLTLLGGNHRTQAHVDAGHTTIAAYIVEVTDEAAAVVMYRDNVANGLRPSRKELLLQAVHLVNQGHQQRAVAHMLGLHEAALSNAMQAHHGSLRAADLGIASQWSQLADGHHHRLGTITSDVLFTEAVKMVAATGMNTTDTSGLVSNLKKTRSETDGLRLIGHELEERLQATAGGRSRPADTEFKRATRTLFTLSDLDVRQVAASAPTSDARRRMRADLKTVTEKLIALDRALK